jgi:hypothetical protein
MPDTASSSSVRSRRRAVRAVAPAHHANGSPSLGERLLLLASSPAAKTTFVVIGTVGLAALAVALVGPKRLEKDVIRPLRGAIEPQAEKLWADAKPLRDQIAGLLENATPAGRKKPARSFQSWIGHFHAS